MRIWIRNNAFFHANLRICDLGTGTPNCDLEINHYICICGFAICGLAQLRNVRICDCEMSPRICDLWINEMEMSAPRLCIYKTPNFNIFAESEEECWVQVRLVLHHLLDRSGSRPSLSYPLQVQYIRNKHITHFSKHFFFLQFSNFFIVFSYFFLLHSSFIWLFLQFHNLFSYPPAAFHLVVLLHKKNLYSLRSRSWVS